MSVPVEGSCLASQADRSLSMRAATAAPSRQELRAIFARKPLNNLVRISGHAVDRYRARFRSDLPSGTAKGRLYAAMRERGQYTPILPEWLVYVDKTKRVRKSNCGYIIIDDEIALPLRANTMLRATGEGRRPQPYVAITCLYRFQR